MSTPFTPSSTDVRHTSFSLPEPREVIASEVFNDTVRKLANNEAGTRADLTVAEADIVALEASVAALPASGTLNGAALSGTLTIQGTSDQVGVATVGSTITVRLATTQAAGDYVMRSDGAGGVSWVPFEPGGGEISIAYTYTTWYFEQAVFATDERSITGVVISSY